jgi:hypothetical protein
MNGLRSRGWFGFCFIVGVVISFGAGYYMGGSNSILPQSQQSGQNIHERQTELKPHRLPGEETHDKTSISKHSKTEPLTHSSEHVLEKAGLNLQGSQELVQKLYGGQAKEKIDSIHILGKIGSPKIKADIEALIKDKNEDPDVKIAALSSLDWSKEPLKLLELFAKGQDYDLLGETQDHDILATAVAVSTRIDMDKDIRGEFNKTFLKIYDEVESPELRLAIIGYFGDKPELNQLLNPVDPKKLDPIVSKYVQELREDLERINNYRIN